MQMCADSCCGFVFSFLAYNTGKVDAFFIAFPFPSTVCDAAAPCVGNSYCEQLNTTSSKCVCSGLYFGASCNTLACSASPCLNSKYLQSSASS